MIGLDTFDRCEEFNTRRREVKAQLTGTGYSTQNRDQDDEPAAAPDYPTAPYLWALSSQINGGKSM